MAWTDTRVSSRVGQRAAAVSVAAALCLGAAAGAARAAEEKAQGAQSAQSAQISQSAVPCGQNAPAGPVLRVKVIGAHSAKGNITFTVYGQNPSAFLVHHGWIARSRVMLAGTSAEACFAVSAPGSYALAVFHDENDNHRFDRTLIGLPAEGYGFSNDAPTPVGLPSFQAARFTVEPGENRITIRLRY